jgi:hypothetical protein
MTIKQQIKLLNSKIEQFEKAAENLNDDSASIQVGYAEIRRLRNLVGARRTLHSTSALQRAPKLRRPASLRVSDPAQPVC